VQCSRTTSRVCPYSPDGFDQRGLYALPVLRAILAWHLVQDMVRSPKPKPRMVRGFGLALGLLSRFEIFALAEGGPPHLKPPEFGWAHRYRP
jgi:hypothetical protein